MGSYCLAENKHGRIQQTEIRLGGGTRVLQRQGWAPIALQTSLMSEYSLKDSRVGKNLP
jgi:hypothetical protein